MIDEETVRRRDADATKARILSVAQVVFSELGYSHAGIREIATRAGTSSTLVLRYYGSKAGLFRAALEASMPVAAAIAGKRETFGADLARALLDPENAIRPPLMIALASGDPEAAAIAASVFEEKSVRGLANWLGGEEARARALQIAMISTGLVFYLRQLPIDPFSDIELDGVTAWFEKVVQDLVDSAGHGAG
ncbi:hypothetical protein B2G71_01410 [Novosphingobium sp. PC22D]|uniref:TetR/AcrR family transcriptional regulator n=1 Tax=Novosphingobium sp. PC22D TaxID=1962403 RepID=UPI000BFAF090|nr:TetR/AcrR family transcriptional regulator [Novosphingobium sp. PC22D]PEQ14289.1 hypothetical protein B2G71_01410 [Novosphingobium sp. PC22D]